MLATAAGLLAVSADTRPHTPAGLLMDRDAVPSRPRAWDS
jgi:hypothetical protein